METRKNREEEATSKETLEDIEESESMPDGTNTDTTDGPSPDGALDEPKELHDADPM